MDIIKDIKLLHKTGRSQAVSSLVRAGEDYMALLFTTSWSPPCQDFLPLLAGVVDKLHTEEHINTLKVIYVPCENKDDAWHFYTTLHGDWCMLPYSYRITKQLQDTLDVDTVPSLVLFSPSGELLTTRGRRDVQDKGVLAYSSWVVAAKKLAMAEAEEKMKLFLPEEDLNRDA